MEVCYIKKTVSFNGSLTETVLLPFYTDDETAREALRRMISNGHIVSLEDIGNSIWIKKCADLFCISTVKDRKECDIEYAICSGQVIDMEDLPHQEVSNNQQKEN